MRKQRKKQKSINEKRIKIYRKTLNETKMECFNERREKT